jgi:hypothetical protein
VEALRRSAWSVALTVGVVTLGWLLLLPWDLSVIGLPGANGDLFERDETRFAFIALMVLVAIWCGVLTYIDAEGALPRGVAAMATIGVWYLWRASAANVVDTNVWLSALIDVILPPTAAAAFVGSSVGSFARRRRRPGEQREERVSGPEAPR